MTSPTPIRNAVVDASAIVDLLLDTRQAAPLLAALQSPEVDLHTPALCDVEVTAALRVALLRGHIESLAAALLLATDLAGLPIRRYDHGSLLPRVLELRHNFSAYDASYVVLAEALGIPLLTADARLAAAAHEHTDVAVHLTCP